MMATNGSHTFSTLDYILFGLTLCLSSSIGIFYAIRSWRTKAGVDDYLIGSRSMPLIPISLSLLATFISGISIVSYPAEVFTNGLVFYWMPMSAPFSIIVTCLLFVPVFYRMSTEVSIFAYFEHRFGSVLLRSYASVLCQLTTLASTSIVLYAPTIVLANVSGGDVRLMIVIIGLICTLYTSIGGLRAVVWTDAFQLFIMFAGLIALAVKGTQEAGGVANIFQTAYESGRVHGLWNIDPNPFQYMTAWTASFGGFFYWLSYLGPSQVILQRCCSLPTLTKAKLSILLIIPLMIAIMALIIYIGLAMIPRYVHCDPRLTEKALQKDQLLVTFMMDTLGSVYGLPGLFLACILSATLSTVSSCINSLSANFLEDIIKPLRKNEPLTDAHATVIAKLAGFTYGLIALGLAFAAGPLGGIFKTVSSVVGGLGGPVLGMFVLGIVFPCANWIGTLAGSVVGHAVVLWIIVGNIVNKVAYSQLPSDTDVCQKENGTYFTTPWLSTTIPSTTNKPMPLFWPELHGIEEIYAISYVMYSCIGATTTILVGLLVSFLTSCCNVKTAKVTDSRPAEETRRPQYIDVACASPLEDAFIKDIKDIKDIKNENVVPDEWSDELLAFDQYLKHAGTTSAPVAY